MKKIGITFLSAILGITTAFAAELISKETAQEIALRHAGVDPSKLRLLKLSSVTIMMLNMKWNLRLTA